MLCIRKAGNRTERTSQILHLLIKPHCCCCRIAHSSLDNWIHLLNISVVTPNKVFKVLVRERFLATTSAPGVEREEAREEVDGHFARGPEAAEQRGCPASVKKRLKCFNMFVVTLMCERLYCCCAAQQYACTAAQRRTKHVTTRFVTHLLRWHFTQVPPPCWVRDGLDTPPRWDSNHSKKR